jgi:succinate-acetate transporter protein
MGYFILGKKKLFLIVGYNTKTFRGDRNKLAKAMGMFFIFVGILTFLFAFTLEYFGSYATIFFSIIITFASIGIGIYVNNLNRK